MNDLSYHFVRGADGVVWAVRLSPFNSPRPPVARRGERYTADGVWTVGGTCWKCGDTGVYAWQDGDGMDQVDLCYICRRIDGYDEELAAMHSMCLHNPCVACAPRE